jgi:hypothetical protein
LAKLNIVYNCGCRFLTHDINEAIKHCDETGHDMSVHGIIYSDNRYKIMTPKPKTPKLKPRSTFFGQPEKSTQEQPALSDMKKDIASLRERLQKRGQ